LIDSSHTRHFASRARGEIYGLAHAPARFRERSLRPKTPVPGLWAHRTGRPHRGIGGAVAGGYLAVSAIAGKPLLPR
jgi:all-trans-retinol 13,14-reductase